MSRYIDILNHGKEMLKKAGIEDYATDARLLFEESFQMDLGSYFLRQMEENDSEGRKELYYKAIAERSKHMPLQYITGHQVFMGFDFKVNEYTLIPRQDTETLVELAVKELNKLRRAMGENADKAEYGKIKALDMCTGSGCIGISIAKLAGSVSVTGADISGEALKAAAENKINLGAENIIFVQSDLFSNIGNNRYDMIVSNPPYIKTEDIRGLKEEVRNHEPLMALDGSADGLDFYRRITKAAPDHLTEGGILLYEIGCDQAESVVRIMEENGFGKIRVEKDMAGLDRVVIGKLGSVIYKLCK